MTKKQATWVLICAAGKYTSGAGQGLSERPTQFEQNQIKDAARKLWPLACECSDGQLRNLGIR